MSHFSGPPNPARPPDGAWRLMGVLHRPSRGVKSSKAERKGGLRRVCRAQRTPLGSAAAPPFPNSRLPGFLCRCGKVFLAEESGTHQPCQERTWQVCAQRPEGRGFVREWEVEREEGRVPELGLIYKCKGKLLEYVRGRWPRPQNRHPSQPPPARVCRNVTGQ